MNKITMTIYTDNAEFDNGNCDIAVGRILKELSNQIIAGNKPTVIKDINGNRTGVIKYG